MYRKYRVNNQFGTLGVRLLSDVAVGLSCDSVSIFPDYLYTFLQTMEHTPDDRPPPRAV